MLFTQAVFVFVLIVFGNSNTQAQESFAFHHVNVNGTNHELRLNCPGEATASRGEDVALREIDRLVKILGSYDAESELNQWLELGCESAISQELRDVLEANQQWHVRTRGAFHPGVEQLTRLWKTAEQKQLAPSPLELSNVIDKLKHLGWQWNTDRSQAKPSPGVRLSFNAIAKGYIIDAVCTKLSHLQGIDGGLLAIGGDMRAF